MPVRDGVRRETLFMANFLLYVQEHQIVALRLSGPQCRNPQNGGLIVAGLSFAGRTIDGPQVLEWNLVSHQTADHCEAVAVFIKKPTPAFGRAIHGVCNT